MNDRKDLSPAELLFLEQDMAEPRKKEAARRIIELSGELHLSYSEKEAIPLLPENKLEFLLGYAEGVIAASQCREEEAEQTPA